MLSRRDALKTFAAVLGAPALSEAAWAQAMEVRTPQAAAAGAGLKFFTAEQFRTVDVMTELIIPADARSGGARAARVAEFIDLLLSGADDDVQNTWRHGLAALDDTTDSGFKKPFADCTLDEQVALLMDISRREDDPVTLLEKLFTEVKTRTIQGYYTSRIGIHDELKYQGQQFIDQFVGCTHPEHGA
jgi:hypothetical protein